jgi:hypothetical protein
VEETPGEEHVRAELKEGKEALILQYQEWVEHYYPEGEAPPAPQPFNDAVTVLLAAKAGEEAPAGTLGRAAGLILALRKLEGLVEIANVEWDITYNPKLDPEGDEL